MVMNRVLKAKLSACLVLVFVSFFAAQVAEAHASKQYGREIRHPGCAFLPQYKGKYYVPEWVPNQYGGMYPVCTLRDRPLRQYCNIHGQCWLQ